MIRGLKVDSIRKTGTGFSGGLTYLAGVAEWKGRKTLVFVFPKNADEEKKFEDAAVGGQMVFDAARYDFVVGHGLSLHEAELK